MSNSKLERLASELETIHDRQDELKPLIAKVRDDTTDRDLLFQELIFYKLGFFAYKLKEGYYDDNPLPAEQPASPQSDTQIGEQVQPSPQPVGVEICSICQARIDSELHAQHQALPNEPAAPEQPKEPAQEEVKASTPEPQAPKPGMTTTETLSQLPQEEVKPDPNTLPDCPACAGHKPQTKQHPDQV